MFRHVLWLAFLSLTWSEGYPYVINATDGPTTDIDRSNGSNVVLMPLLGGTDPAVNSTLPFEGMTDNATTMPTLESQLANKLTTSLYQDDTLISACQLTTHSQLTVIKSSSFPNNYGPNLDCQYTVRRNSSAWCSVTFLFNVLDLEESEECSKDYIDLAGERLCGYNPSGVTRIVHFKGSEVTMKFHSDEDVFGLGFLLTAVQQECPPPSCDDRFTHSQFELSSPNFPSTYENRRICDYVIVKSSRFVCKLRIQVELFDVEYDDKCEADFFELNGEKFCGVMSEGQIVEMDFPNTEMLGRFRSDYATTRSGFLFEVTQIECPSEMLSTNQSEVENIPEALSTNQSDAENISEALSTNQSDGKIAPNVTESSQMTLGIKSTQQNFEDETKPSGYKH
ncbi:cubilin-like [Limulus polyphemus]|uniref:Cubilin-like n=1 Tax=Limulus polyphemus TaxID=6850 RepID=A0ABM1SRX8_LIMPO|nr:cubilin-like [Limulus polyphemus]